MVAYRRNFLPGGTFFFTVTLKDRRSTLPVEHIDRLRQAFRQAREQQPFSILALVVLPDHLHAVLGLPAHEADFPGRWRRIKALFTHSLVACGIPISRCAKGEYSLWQRR
ncbi:MAG TPA: transposase, partial [Burkholderiales bacterium]